MNEGFVSVSALAEKYGISKAAISKAVAAYAKDNGLEVNRSGKNQIVTGVNATQFDALRARYNDTAKARPIAPVVPPPPQQAGTTSLDEERRRKLITDNSIASLRLFEDSLRLVRRDVMTDALTRLGGEVNRVLDLQPYADDLTAAMATGGPHGLRVALKKIGHKLREDIAAHFDTIASLAPEGDPLLPVQELEEQQQG